MKGYKMKKALAALFLFAVTAIAAAFDFGTPVTRSLDLSTSYQATDNTKAAVISFSAQCSMPECALEVRIGTGTLDCVSGTVVATWVNSWPRVFPSSVFVPAGASFILCSTGFGDYVVPIAAVDQSAG